jgi:hypothetical protein
MGVDREDNPRTKEGVKRMYNESCCGTNPFTDFSILEPSSAISEVCAEKADDSLNK